MLYLSSKVKNMSHNQHMCTLQSILLCVEGLAFSKKNQSMIYLLSLISVCDEGPKLEG